MTKAKPKKTIVKCSGSTLLFTSAGTLRPGQTLSLPKSEAARLMAKGRVVEVIKRRKKSSVNKDAATGDGGGSGDSGAEQNPSESLQPTQE